MTHEQVTFGAANTSNPDVVDVPLLEIDDLRIEYPVDGGTVAAVRGVDLKLAAGETVGLVGESGSGKSTVALAILGVIDAPGRVSHGDIRFRGRSIVGLTDQEMRGIRGKHVGIVYQEPTTALNPVLSVGFQVREAIRAHSDLSRREADDRTCELFEAVGIPDPRRRMRQYPHNLSGGLKQRVMITMALASDPELLIADEPTTALDVTIQAQILDLIERLSEERHMAVLWITHDLGVVARIADRIAVMYAGTLVEDGPRDGVLSAPAHPYTAALLQSIPSLTSRREDRLTTIEGQLPDPKTPQRGCAFAPRCRLALERCAIEPPPVRGTADGWNTRCWLA